MLDIANYTSEMDVKELRFLKNLHGDTRPLVSNSIFGLAHLIDHDEMSLD